MNSKERVLATYERGPVDRTPIDCWLYQKQFLELLEAEYGTREQFLDEFGIDIFVGFAPWPNQLGYKIDVTDLADVDLGDPKDPRWLNHTDWNYDFGGMNIKDAIARHGDKRAIIAHTWGMVEGTSSFLGIENCWMNLGLYPDLMTAWFDRYSDWLCGLAEGLKDIGVDIMTLSDDWGSNQRMLFSPKMWRSMIAPYAAKVVRHARSVGLHVNLHSDGHILDIVPDLITIGYSSMHPVQESAGMDPQTIKSTFGDRIIIYGSLDVIDGLLAYDGDALDEYITRRFEIYAPNGGFIFNTGHFVQPDIPPGRLVRAYARVNELARRYGSA